MEGISKVGSSQLALFHVVAITLIDNDTIRHLHDATLDALKLISGASQLYQEEKVYHRVTSRFALTYTNGFHEHLVITSCLTEYYRFSGLSGYTTQRTSRGTRTDEGLGMHGELFHSGFVSQDTTLGALATGVYGQDGQLASVFLQDMNSKLVYTGTLACSWHTADTDAHAISAIWQALFYYLLSYGNMLRQSTFH